MMFYVYNSGISEIAEFWTFKMPKIRSYNSLHEVAGWTKHLRATIPGFYAVSFARAQIIKLGNVWMFMGLDLYKALLLSL